LAIFNQSFSPLAVMLVELVKVLDNNAPIRRRHDVALVQPGADAPARADLPNGVIRQRCGKGKFDLAELHQPAESHETVSDRFLDQFFLSLRLLVTEGMLRDLLNLRQHISEPILAVVDVIMGKRNHGNDLLWNETAPDRGGLFGKQNRPATSAGLDNEKACRPTQRMGDR
jgi:hypothetical protein